MPTEQIWTIGFMLLLMLAVAIIVIAERPRQCDACRNLGRKCWHDDERHLHITARDEKWATVEVVDGKGLQVVSYRVPRHPLHWPGRVCPVCGWDGDGD